MALAEWQHPFAELLDNEFKLWSAGDDAPNVAEVAALEERLGCSFPTEYCKYLSRYGGVMLEVLERVWPRTEKYSVGPFWSFQYGYVVLGIGKDIPDWLDIEAMTAELHRDFPESMPLIPFFRQIATRKFYLCFDKGGRIFEWSCEEPAERRLMGENFDTIIMRETKTLVENKEKIKLLSKTK